MTTLTRTAPYKIKPTWWLTNLHYFIFMMREVLGIETDEICKELAITATNCWVLLYRARMSLRACLEERWFAIGA